MRREPLVTVVIPTYNGASTICQTIDNVFEQTYSNFELIVVDDGSADDTLSRLGVYGNRIRVISQTNMGPAVARNRGVESARGEIIAFQDADDLWRPSKLERQVALLEHFGPRVPCCLCNVLMRVVDGKEHTSFDHSLIRIHPEEGLWLNVADVLATRFVLFNQAVAIRRDALEMAGGFDPKLKYLEDYDLPLRLALQGPWAFIREPLVVYGSGSPDSFSQMALRDPIVLRQCELEIYKRLLARSDTESRHSFCRHLRRRQGIARRKLWAVESKQTNRGAARAICEVVTQLDRLYLAAFRRSPWFPRPQTIPVDGGKDDSGEEVSSDPHR